MAKACTEEQVERIIEQWHAGIGPTDLHDALGWTWEEYQRYENAMSGASDESAAKVLASFAPATKIHFLDNSRAKATHFYNKALDFVESEHAGRIFIGNVHVTPERPCPPNWHVAPVPGQERFIVRSTTTGVARLAPAPNDFHSASAAQRRADQLNEKETP